MLVFVREKISNVVLLSQNALASNPPPLEHHHCEPVKQKIQLKVKTKVSLAI